MILLVWRGKLKRLFCSLFGHRISGYGDDLRDDVYDPGDFCDRCGLWL